MNEKVIRRPLAAVVPVLGYTKLVNWLSDPYKKSKNKTDEQPQQVYSE